MNEIIIIFADTFVYSSPNIRDTHRYNQILNTVRKEGRKQCSGVKNNSFHWKIYNTKKKGLIWDIQKEEGNKKKGIHSHTDIHKPIHINDQMFRFTQRKIETNR